MIFELLTAPETWRTQIQYRFAEHKVVEAAPRLQWLANELQKISLELRFNIAFTNPATQMNRLRAAADDHQARALVFANGQHRGYFVIERIEETLVQLADDGSYIAIEARLELCEWIPGADFDPLAPPRQASPPPGVVQKSASKATSASALSTPVNVKAIPYDPNQPVSPHNLRPLNAITQLTSGGAPANVSYSPVPYSQPGVSGLAGKGPPATTPGDPGSVPPPTIVRAG